MRFQCTHCLGVLAIEDAEAGEPVACGTCGGVVLVPATRFSPGAVLDDFVIRGRLGAGEMGAVFQAQQLSLDRPVALRVLHARFHDDPDFLAELARVAHTASLLKHPNIVEVYASGEEEDVFFLAMHLFQGSTLWQVLEHSGSMVPERALDIAVATAAALDYAWTEQQLVHGAVKSENVVLHDQGHIQLADIGLVRPCIDWLTTADEPIQGGPWYTAPEEILGGNPSPAGDLYSLGAVLYHAVTGQLPYTGPTGRAVAEKHLTTPLPPPRQLAPRLSPPLADIIQILLAKRPEHRYASATELLQDLERARRGEMPTRALDAEAQSPLGVPAGRGRAVRSSAPRKAHLRRAPSETGTDLSGGETEPAPVVPTPDSEGAGKTPLSEEGIPGKSRRAGLWVGVALLFVLVAAGVGFGIWRMRQESGVAAPAPGGLSREKPSSGKRGEQAAAAEIRTLLASHAGADKVLPRLAAFGHDYPAAREMAAELKQGAADLIEQEIGEQRAKCHDTEKDAWRKRVVLLREEARKAAEEKARREQAAAEERRRRQEEERKAELRARKDRELAKAREELRWKAAELCRKNQFADARLLFAPIAEAENPDAQAWAKNKQACIDLAEKAFKLVAGSGDKLKGQRFTVPKHTGKGRIDYIGTDGISIVFAEKVLNDKGENLGERIVDRVRIPLVDVPEALFWQLCRATWEKGHDNPADLYECFGAYLLSRGRYLADARRYLIQCGKPETTTPLIEELDVMANEIRRQEWDSHWKRVLLLRDKDNAKGVRQYLDWLKLHYPKEYEGHTQDVQGILQGH